MNTQQRFWAMTNQLYPFTPKDFYYKKTVNSSNGKENFAFFYRRFANKRIPVDYLPSDEFILKIPEWKPEDDQVFTGGQTVDPGLARLASKHRAATEEKRVWDRLETEDKRRKSTTSTAADEASAAADVFASFFNMSGCPFTGKPAPAPKRRVSGMAPPPPQSQSSGRTPLSPMDSADSLLMVKHKITNKAKYIRWLKDNHQDRGGDKDVWRSVFEAGKRVFKSQ